jgi:tRNA A-37 threonylcarbamoyl transferase component Bud32
MAVTDIIGFDTYTEVKSDIFYKKYDNIEEVHWLRIRNASRLLSEEGIGPKVICIDEINNTIQYERVIPVDDRPDIPNMSSFDIVHAITILVDRLHSLGYGHGDLHIENLGYKDDKFYILDHDTIYKIEDLYHNKAPWLELWMEHGFSWHGSFEDFVNHDYKNWYNDVVYMYK